MHVIYCSRVIKTKQELEVLRYVNRISSEAHKKVLKIMSPLVESLSGFKNSPAVKNGHADVKMWLANCNKLYQCYQCPTISRYDLLNI